MSGGTLGSGSNAGNIVVNADTLDLAGLAAGTGTLTIQPRTVGRSIGLGGGAGDLNLSAATLSNLHNLFSEVVIGNATSGDISVGAGLAAFQDNLRLNSAGALTINGLLGTGNNRLTLNIAGATTQSAAISAAELLLLNGTGSYTLTNAANNVGTIAASTGSVSFVHGGSAALSVGLVGSTSGIEVNTLSLSSSGAAAGIVINQDVTTRGTQDYVATLASIIVNSGADLVVTGKAALTMTAGSRIVLTGGTLSNQYGVSDGAFSAIALKANEAGTGSGSGDAAIKLASGARIQTAAGGAGNISLLGNGSANVAHGVFVDASVIESQGAGTVSITGTGGTAAAGTNMGVYLKGAATDITSAFGAIAISGTGGASSGQQNYGVHIHDGASVISTGTGAAAATINITGLASNTGSGATNMGIYLADTGASVTSIDGDITLIGTGALASTSNNNIGVRILNNSKVESTGATADAAKITIVGTGGGTGATSQSNQGVSLQGATALITSAYGDISVTGTGSASAGSVNNHGIHLIDGSQITSTGTGSDAASINLVGNGGGDAMSAASNTNIGIYLVSSGARIDSIAGDITLTGVGGAGANGTTASHYGIQIGSGTQVRSTGTGADAANIIINGTGGSGTGNNRFGVYLNADRAVESSAGSITIVGRGGASAGGSGNDGLYVSGTGAKVASGSGDIVVDALKGGGTGKDFNNLTGAAALQSVSGRWIVYLGQPGDSTLNNMVSGNLPIWDATRATLVPASVGTGNRYVFSYQPTLTVSSGFSDTKTYGSAYSFPTLVRGTHYSIAGLVNAANYQNVWTQETLANIGLSGTPTLSSAGSGASAGASVTPSAINVGNGTLANAAGYAFGTPTSTGTLTVNPKALTLTGVTAAGKVYDGGTAAALSGGALQGVVGSDSVGFSAGSGAFASQNTGTWSVTASGYALSGDDAGNYSLSQPVLASATISAKALTIGAPVIADKVYDGSTAAGSLTLGALSGLVGSETLGISGLAAALTDKDVGAYSTSVSYLLSDGRGLASNYTLADSTGVAATISAKALTLTGVTAAGKVYDGGTAAALSGGALQGVVGSDSVGFSAGSGAFASQNTGTWSVTASGYALSGDDAGNYSLSQPVLASATISAKALNIGVVALDKIYDGDRSALLDFSTSDVVGGDDVDYIYTALFSDKMAGAGKVVSLTSGVTLSGADAANYSLVIDPAVLASLSADIDARTLTIGSVAALGKTYDGEVDAQLTITTADILAGDVVTFDYAATFADRNAGAGKGVSVASLALSGTDGGNYDMVLDPALIAGLTADISRKALTIDTVAALGKVYDGSSDVVLDVSTNDILSGDEIGFAYDAQTTDANAGLGKAVAVSGNIVTLTGNDAQNYDLGYDTALLAGLQVDVAAKNLVVTNVTAHDKIYDANTSATLSFTTGDILGGDSVTFGYTAAFADKAAGIDKMVAAIGPVVLSGADAGNYQLVLDASLLADLAADISPRMLTVSDVAALGKVYDGALAAELAFTDDGLAGDDIGFDYAAFFSDANAGAGKSVTVAGGNVTLTGADSANYALALDPALLAALAADIARKSLNVTGVSTVSKTYDGTAAITLEFAANGRVTGDDISYTYEALAAGSGAGIREVAVKDDAVSLAGAAAGNYDLVLDPALLAGLNARINARSIVVSAVAANNKIYDGNTVAGLSIASEGIVGGDDVAFGFDAVFADKAAGTGKAVSVVGGAFSLKGNDAANYVLSLDPVLLSGLSADIAQRTLSISDVLSLGKVYDGSRTATLDFVTGDILSGDQVGFDYIALFGDKNAGVGKAIAVSGETVTLTGTDSGNYALLLDPQLLSGLTADIDRKVVTVTDVGTVSKVYDGTAGVGLTFSAEGIVNGDRVDFTHDARTDDANAGNGKIVNVGVVGMAGPDARNYDLVLDDSLLAGLTTDIALKDLIVAVNDQTRLRFMPDPPFSYILIGLATDDDASSVSGVTFTTGATPGSATGSYRIEAANGRAPNYRISYRFGTLTVVAAPLNDSGLVIHAPLAPLDGGRSGQVNLSGFIQEALGADSFALFSEGGAELEEVDSDGSLFCSNRSDRDQLKNLPPYLQVNMRGRALYCLGSASGATQ